MSSFGTINPELLGLARQNVAKLAKPTEKQAFVAGGDPSMMGGGDPMMGGGGMPPGGAPPMDPSMMGGAPPMDPSMMGGAPPMGGGMPPGGGTSPDQLMQQVAAGANAGAAGGKPAIKVDQNMVMLQMLKLLARIADASGVKITASDMVVTPEDVSQMAQGGPGYAAATPDGGGGAEGGGASAIPPIEPMQAAAPDMGGGKMARDQGSAFDSSSFDTSSFSSNGNKAAAIMAMRRQRQGAA